MGGKLKAGTYTIIPRPGSPSIAGFASAPGLPPARVKASVAGKGASARFAATKKPPTRFRPFSELRRR